MAVNIVCESALNIMMIIIFITCLSHSSLVVADIIVCVALIRVNIIMMVMKMLDLQLLMLTTLNYAILAPTMPLISTLN